MLIKKLLQPQALQVAKLTVQGQQRQKQMQAEQWLLRQRATAFISSAPGLMLSFSAGCLFQLRHNDMVKTLRKLVGVSWLRSWF
jgi:hypothetical protein